MNKNLIIKPQFYTDILIPDKTSGIILLYLISEINSNSTLDENGIQRLPPLKKSVRTLENDFPFFTNKQIRNAIKNMEEKELIIVKKSTGRNGGLEISIGNIFDYVILEGQIKGKFKPNTDGAFRGIAKNKGQIKTHNNKSKNTGSEKEKEQISWVKLQEIWNQKVPERKIHKITERRKVLIRARINSTSKTEFALMVQKFSESDFLCGRSKIENDKHMNFKADFDWAINETNYVKIIEGKYDNKHHKQQVYNRPKQAEFI